MKPNRTVNNICVIVVLAAIVYAVPRGDVALSFLEQLIGLAFLASVAWIASRLYREHHMDLYSLGTRRRTILYVAIGAATLAFTAVSRLWGSGVGTVVWLLILGACAYAVYAVFRSTRQY